MEKRGSYRAEGAGLGDDTLAQDCSGTEVSRKWTWTSTGARLLSGSPVPAERARAARGRRQRGRRARGGGFKRVIRREPDPMRSLAAVAAAAGMASAHSPARALLLLTCASLIAAMGLPEPAAPGGNQAHPRLPGNELPTSPADSLPVRCSRAPDLPVPGDQRLQEGVQHPKCPGQGLSETKGCVVAPSARCGGFGGRILLSQ